MDVQELGFSPFVDEDYEERGEAIVAQLSPHQIEALRNLEQYRRKYFKDLEDFARRRADAELRDRLLRDDPDINIVDMSMGIAVSSGHLALSMSDKFSLQMAEILVFGERQGDLPEMETARIIEI
jgi:hypothetical protein